MNPDLKERLDAARDRVGRFGRELAALAADTRRAERCVSGVLVGLAALAAAGLPSWWTAASLAFTVAVALFPLPERRSPA